MTLLSVAIGAGAPGRVTSTSPGDKERVVSLVPAITETIVAFGGASRLVARTRFDTAAALTQLPSIGGAVNPDLEALVAVRPDLVITWEHGGGRALAAQLRALGIDSYFGEARSIADFRRHGRAVGALLGRAEAADSLVRRVDEALAGLTVRVPEAERPSVMLVLWPQPLLTTGAGTFVDELVRLVGARGAFDDLQAPWPTVSFEEAVVRDPDLILFSSDIPFDDGTRGVPPDARWQMLEAMRRGDVRTVDADLFTRPGPHMARAAALLARYLRDLHGEREGRR